MTGPGSVHLPRRRLPLVVLAVMSVVTAGVTTYVAYTAGAKDELRFLNAVEDLRFSIERRLDTYVALLRSTTGLFAASDTVTRDDFRTFIAQLDLPRRYPGVQGIGFSIRVPAAGRAALERQLAGEGMARFRIWPEGDRPVYNAIIYLEPLDRRNLAAIGYDMATEAARRAAMDQACDTGLPAASGKVTLVQEIDPQKQAGFLIYVPVYRHDVAIATVEERRSALLGFVYSPFRAGDMLSSLFDGRPRDVIRLMVFDGDAPSPSSLLHDSAHPGAAEATPPAGRYTTRASVEIAGRPWTLVFSTGPAFEGALEGTLIPFVLAGGLLTTLALTGLMWLQVRARDAAERVAAELRAAEQEREGLLAREREAHAEAQAANRAKDEFLAMLSHELRTPLNAVLGWTRMLRAGQLEPARQAHALEVIERNAQAQAGLIEDLLDLSRIVTGQLRLDLRPVELAAAVRATIDGMRPMAEAKTIELKTALEAGGLVVGDVDRIQQIATNLLSNAIKFTPAGGRIEVATGQDGASAVLSVQDTGIGIAPDFLPHIFDRFRQADATSTRAYGGMGLGLSIVRHLVESMRGTIRAESGGEGRGARFLVTFPLMPVPPPAVEAVRDNGAAPDLGRDLLAGVTVLVIDDDHDSRELQASALEQVGAVVERAASAAEALRLLVATPFDAIVSDLAMPDTDGVALIREIRVHPAVQLRRVPAIALTAYARHGEQERVLEAGFQMYLRKPVDIARLQSAVAWVTGRV